MTTNQLDLLRESFVRLAQTDQIELRMQREKIQATQAKTDQVKAEVSRSSGFIERLFKR